MSETENDVFRKILEKKMSFYEQQIEPKKILPGEDTCYRKGKFVYFIMKYVYDFEAKGFPEIGVVVKNANTAIEKEMTMDEFEEWRKEAVVIG